MIKKSILFKNITYFNKYILMTFSILIILTSGLTSYAVFSNNAYGNQDILVRIKEFILPVVNTVTKARNTTNKNVVVTANLTDNKGVVAWQYSTTNTVPTTWRTITSATSTNQTFSTTTPGTYYVWAKDAAGNIALSKSINVSTNDVDFTAPVINLTKSGVSTSITVTVGITDNIGVITWYDPTYGWRNITSTTSMSSSFVVTSAGTYTVYANDAAGNQGSASIVVAATDLLQLTGITGTYTGSVMAVGSTIDKNQISVNYLYNVASYNHTGTASSCTLSSNTLPSNLRVTVTCAFNGIQRSAEVFIRGWFGHAYVGYAQSFTVPVSGYYDIELWGAEGGRIQSALYEYYDRAGGGGGYTKGTIYLYQGEILYVYVGETNKTLGLIYGTFNGGGGNDCSYEDRPQYVCSGAGGGATDIRIGGTALGNRIMVAGGGGGTGGNKGQNNLIDIGGFAGGLTGDSPAGDLAGNGGTQTSGGAAPPLYKAGYTRGTKGELGVGGTGGDRLGSGGGGGYYGGSGASGEAGYSPPGGGGSSYISGYPGCSTASRVFTNPQMIAGNTSMPSPYGGVETGHIGSGYAKITFVSG